MSSGEKYLPLASSSLFVKHQNSCEDIYLKYNNYFNRILVPAMKQRGQKDNIFHSVEESGKNKSQNKQKNSYS